MSNKPKFRHTGGPLRVTTLAGHCTILDDNWVELPEPLHAAAIRAGAEVDQGKVQAKDHKTEASKDAKSNDDEASLTKKAIRDLLKTNDPEDFNTDGSPKVKSVARVAGFNVSKADVNTAWDELQEEAAKAGDGE